MYLKKHGVLTIERQRDGRVQCDGLFDCKGGTQRRRIDRTEKRNKHSASLREEKKQGNMLAQHNVERKGVKRDINEILGICWLLTLTQAQSDWGHGNRSRCITGLYQSKDRGSI